ncbi:alpha-2-macroglobulin-like protein [Plakobranchus ocellatus]|uniref:Alpha-2-macroglobulin-like protein n=1 Tax=Plakobranchus ocellatus TaxID=259542 RepID=A0AAV4BGK4_9GAST|nr:alpha-2-macroglobulin-like protein [Plakobranchus ocellatus]
MGDQSPRRWGEVKFRILTLLTTLKPRAGQIFRIYVLDPKGIRVKVYKNVITQGIKHIDFQLDKEAELGVWKIEVTDNSERRGIARFRVKSDEPSIVEIYLDTTSTDKAISGQTCGRYESGTPVKGTLTLKFCWVSYSANGRPLSKCHVVDYSIYGCHKFSVKTSLIGNGNPYSDLYLRAEINDSRTGVTSYAISKEKRRTREPLVIRLDDYTNGFYKPGMPYHGKVTVTQLDGTPVSGEKIVVTAVSRDDSLQFSSEFTTDKSGEVEFALCGNLTEVTSLKISAQSIRFEIPAHEREDMLWKKMNKFNSSRSNVRYVRQWFSPSLSYIQLPKIQSPLKCGQRLFLQVLYTARVGSKMIFTCQTTYRGQTIVMRQFDVMISARKSLAKAKTAPNLCLQKDNASSHRELRDDGITDTDMTEGAPFLKSEDEQMQRRGDFVEPIVRSPKVSDRLFDFPLHFEIVSAFSPKFTLLVYYTREDGEVVADSMEYDVEPCFLNRAFDKERHVELFRMLEKLEIDGKGLNDVGGGEFYVVLSAHITQAVSELNQQEATVENVSYGHIPISMYLVVPSLTLKLRSSKAFIPSEFQDPKSTEKEKIKFVCEKDYYVDELEADA